MFSYILKANSQGIPTLVKRIDGSRVAHTHIYDRKLIATLQRRAIVHEMYAILHYASIEDAELDQLITKANHDTTNTTT